MPESPAWLAGKGLRRQAEEIAGRTGVAADEAEGGRTGASRRLFEGEASDVPQRRRGGGGRDRIRLRLRPTVLRRDFRLMDGGVLPTIDAFARARVRARGPPPATPPGGDPSGAAAGGGYQRGDVLRRDDHSSRGGLGAAAAVHLALAVAATSALGSVLGLLAAWRVRTTPSAPRVAPGMRRRVGGARVLFSGRRPGTSSPVSEIATGTCAAAATCRECLAASCRVLRRGRGRGTRAVPGGHSRGDRTARGGRRNARRPSRRNARTRHPEDTIAAPPPPPPPTRSTSSTSRRTRRRSRTLATTGDEGGAPPATPHEARRAPQTAPRAKHRAHQNIVTCDGNWQFHSCPSRLGLLALAAQMLYVTSFQAGMSPVPWVVAAEIFPTGARGAAGRVVATLRQLGREPRRLHHIPRGVRGVRRIRGVRHPSRVRSRRVGVRVRSDAGDEGHVAGGGGGAHANGAGYAGGRGSGGRGRDARDEEPGERTGGGGVRG